MKNHALKSVEDWNRKYPIGTPVNVRRDSGVILKTVTRSEAQLLNGQTPVIWVALIAGCYLLDRVTACVSELPAEVQS